MKYVNPSHVSVLTKNKAMTNFNRHALCNKMMLVLPLSHAMP